MQCIKCVYTQSLTWIWKCPKVFIWKWKSCQRTCFGSGWEFCQNECWCRINFLKCFNSPQCLMKSRDRCIQWRLFFIGQYHYDNSDDCNWSISQNVELSFERNLYWLTSGLFVKYLLSHLRKWLWWVGGGALRRDLTCCAFGDAHLHNFFVVIWVAVAFWFFSSHSAHPPLTFFWVTLGKLRRQVAVHQKFVVKYSECGPTTATVPRSQQNLISSLFWCCFEH